MKIDSFLKSELKTYLEERMSQQDKIVTLVSPYVLQDSEITAIRNKIPILKNAKIIQQQDKDLLGGFLIKFGSKMIDLSIRSELQKLQQRIYEII
jgi:F-type H+-transporting ATPase subunit delta